MAFVLSYAVESWAFTWHGSFIDLILLVYLYKEKKQPQNHPQTNNTVISHPFTSSPNTSENPDGFNTVYSSLRAQAGFILATCRFYDICCLQTAAVIPGYHPRQWCSALAVARLLVTKTWAEPELISDSTLRWLLLFTHHHLSADVCTKNTEDAQNFPSCSLPPPTWNHFIKHTFTQSPYVVMPAVYCSKT